MEAAFAAQDLCDGGGALGAFGEEDGHCLLAGLPPIALQQELEDATLKYVLGGACADPDTEEDSSSNGCSPAGTYYTHAAAGASGGSTSASPGPSTFTGAPAAAAAGSNAATSGWMQLAPQSASFGAAYTTSSASAPAGSTAVPPLLYAAAALPMAAAPFWRPAFPVDSGSKAAASIPSGIPKPQPVSHSSIEKQRRDRINSLIDELRVLVPPSVANGGKQAGADANTDAKRPKHTVLSDTINMLKALQAKVHHEEQVRQRLCLLKHQLSVGLDASAIAGTAAAFSGAGAGLPDAAATAATLRSASMPTVMPGAAAGAMSLADAVCSGAGDAPLPQALLQRTSMPSASAVLASSGSSALDASPDLPQAPPDLPAAVGVLVEEGPGGMLVVKVNCRDRQGLLSDITAALGTLPIQITRAAITTTDGGAVYDVFEIANEPAAAAAPGCDDQQQQQDQQAAAGVTASDVQFCVHQAIYKWRAAQQQRQPVSKGKRQRPA